MRILPTIAFSLLALAVAAHAELRVRLKVNSENVRARTLIESAFRDVIGGIPDIVIDNGSPSVDETLIVNALLPTDNSIAFSTVLLDMDSYLMAVRDSVKEVSIDELKKTLAVRKVSGTVSYATVSTCSPLDLHDAVRFVVTDINKTSFQDLRTDILKYRALSDAPKLPEEDSRPTIGQN
jgi:hypothetical protein